MTCYRIRRSSEHVRRIQHDQDVVLVLRIDPRIRTLFQAVMHNRHRHERLSKLVRRSVPGFHVGRRQCGGRGRDIGHLSQRDVLTVVLPIKYHPRLAPAPAPLPQDLDPVQVSTACPPFRRASLWAARRRGRMRPVLCEPVRKCVWVEQRKWTRFRAGPLMTRVILVPQDPPTHVGPLGQDLISPARSPKLCPMSAPAGAMSHSRHHLSGRPSKWVQSHVDRTGCNRRC